MRVIILLLIISVSLKSYSEGSTCFGTTSKGKLENGVQMPSKGENYVGYSSVARLAGRTYVHSAVRDIIVASYKALEKDQPGKVY